MTHEHMGPEHKVKGVADKIDDGGHADLQEEGQLMVSTQKGFWKKDKAWVYCCRKGRHVQHEIAHHTERGEAYVLIYTP